MDAERLEWEASLAEIVEALEHPEDFPNEDTGDLLKRRGELEALLAVDKTLEEGVDETMRLARQDGAAVEVDFIEPTVMPAADPAAFEHKGAELVVVDQADVFEVLDRHDENMVLEELQKRGVKALFYDFRSDGKQVVDLSIKGVLECVGLMNRTGKCRIHVDPTSAVMGREVYEEKEYIVARVYALDTVTGFGVFGMAKQPVRMVLKSGGDKWDPFAETKALNKAQRNALGMLIPQKIRLAMVAMAKKDAGLAREIQFGVGAAQQAELPPPLDDDRARALIDECRSVYRRLAAVNQEARMPGSFGVGLARAQHSHAMLETYLGELNAQLAHEEAKIA